jgi:DNA polymerase III psi subunit
MKSKNTVLTRYFWDKMSTKAQNLQSELNALGQNPVFVATFIDDVSFVMTDERAAVHMQIQTEVPENQNSEGIEVKSTDKEAEKLTKNSADVPSEPTRSISTAPQELNSVVLIDYKDKVVVITPEKASEAEMIFLYKILAAVAVAPSSVVQIHQKFTARELTAFASAKIILSFGAVIDFIPDHQVRSKAITVIIAKSLVELEQDLTAKKKLWESMKGFFK